MAQVTFDATTIPARANVSAVHPWERLGRAVLLILLVVGLPMAYQRAIDGGPDLAGFCDAGRYILAHGTRDPDSTLARYWPSADVPWMLLCRLPIQVTAIVWYLFGCFAWYGLLRTICNRLVVSPDAALRRHATLTAGLLAMPLVIDGMALGSFHVLMLWLMLEGVDRACRGRAVSGGTLLGIAAWLKLLPMLGIAFLVYQRKWKAALVAMVVVATLNIVLSLAAFGPAGAWREHERWWHQGAAGTTNRQLISPTGIDEDRLTNESVAITLRRLLSSFGSEPGAARNRVQFAQLTAGQLQAAFYGVMALLGVVVAIYCRPTSSRGGSEDMSNKIALLSLATLWFSPVVWSYHFVAATPALAILLMRCRYRSGWVLSIVGLWAGSLCLLGSNVARSAGVLLWMSLFLGVGLALFSLEPHIRGQK